MDDPPVANNTNEAVRSVERCCALLDCLGHATDGMSLTQIAGTLKLPNSTAHRLLSTLSAYGYVERDEDTKRYFLGLRILELQASIAKRFRLLDIAIPHMTKLVQEISVTCHLAVLHDADVVYLESRRSYGDPFFHLHTPPGRSVPAHCTALGKVLLAHLPASLLSQLLSERPLVANTPNTITDHAELRQHLEAVRLRGYAVDDEEFSLGVRCIAAPIRCRTGEVIAAASISGSKDQITPRKDAELARRVAAECDQLFPGVRIRRQSETNGFGVMSEHGQFIDLPARAQISPAAGSFTIDGACGRRPSGFMALARYSARFPGSRQVGLGPGIVA